MEGVSARNFGVLIAYVLPGFVTLWGASLVSPAIHVWLVGSTTAGPEVGGFLYVSIGSVAAGMTVSALRWAVVDWLHAATGLARPAWNDTRLNEQLPAFEALVENHYRYYQFYANMLVALALAYPTWRLSSHASAFCWADLGFLFLEGVFLAASRDALRNYYRRSAILLGTQERTVSHDQRTRQQRRRGQSSPHQSAGKEKQSAPADSDREAGGAVKGE